MLRCARRSAPFSQETIVIGLRDYNSTSESGHVSWDVPGGVHCYSQDMWKRGQTLHVDMNPCFGPGSPYIKSAKYCSDTDTIEVIMQARASHRSSPTPAARTSTIRVRRLRPTTVLPSALLRVALSDDRSWSGGRESSPSSTLLAPLPRSSLLPMTPRQVTPAPLSASAHQSTNGTRAHTHTAHRYFLNYVSEHLRPEMRNTTKRASAEPLRFVRF